MIRKCADSDLPEIYAIINEAAQAYKGIIPDDRWHEPYMPMNELEAEIRDGVEFWGLEENGKLMGVMGIQDKGAVALIRHAYVRVAHQKRGVGTRLIRRLECLANKPVLIGTWAAATWAIRFYERNGYRLLSRQDTDRFLRQYWHIPEGQIVTSVVLANQDCQSVQNG
jgi:N-acetylglutamate synthase-like GNAT family acetyltransferase